MEVHSNAGDDFWGSMENPGFVEAKYLAGDSLRLTTWVYDLHVYGDTVRVPGAPRMSFTVVEGAPLASGLDVRSAKGSNGMYTQLQQITSYK